MTHTQTGQRQRRGTQRTLSLRALSALLLLLLFLCAASVPRPIVAFLYPTLSLEYAPASGLFTLTDASLPTLFSWSGVASAAPSSVAPAGAGALLVNVLGGSTTALINGVAFVASSTNQYVAPAAVASWANLSVEAQTVMRSRGMDTNLTDIGDAVSVLAYAAGAPSVWAVKQYTQRPLVSFVSTRVECDALIPAARSSSFQCRSLVPRLAKDGVTPYTFVANVSTSLTDGSVDHELEDTRVHVVVSLETSVAGAEPAPSDPLFADLLAVAYTKALLLGQQHADVLSLRSSESQRRSSARIAVATMWCAIVITVGFAVALASVWIAWALPFVPNKCLLNAWSIGAIFGVMAILHTILGLTTGLAGFIILFVLMLLTTAVLNLAYCCLRARNRDLDRRNLHPVGDSLVGNAGGAPKHASMLRLGSTGDYGGNSAAVAPAQQDDDRTPLTGGGGGRLAPKSDAGPPTLLMVRNAYNRWPDSLGARQRTFVGHFAMAFLVGAVVCVAIFGLWSVDEYAIWQRASGGPVVEFLPQAVAKATFLVYAYDGFADRIKMNTLFFDVSTQWCGSFYSTKLETDAQKYNSIYKAFILKYSIDMSMVRFSFPYVPSNYTAYNSVNEWFIRSLAPGWRFVASPNDHSVVVQPCDARVMLFPRMPSDSFVWIKDTAYTVEGLIGSAAYAMAQDSFDQGSMALVRLAPQDYHQFHAPVTGTVLSVYTIEGTFHSVNADGMTSQNYAILNQRKVMVLDTTGYANIGRVAYVAIGALCVGSITFVPAVGSLVTKGSSVGYFQFGGSTVAIVFERNTVQFEQDIVEHSAMRIETLVQVGSRMATTL